MNTKFSGLTGENDPLLGNRETTSGRPGSDNFTQQKDDGLGCHVSGLPQFVTVRGGAYFFLPSLSALRYFTS
jgi:hypothetical protein